MTGPNDRSRTAIAGLIAAADRRCYGLTTAERDILREDSAGKDVIASRLRDDRAPAGAMESNFARIGEERTMGMTEAPYLHRLIGSLFMAGMPGPDMDPETEALIREHHLGGVILFARNIEGPVQVARLCGRLQTAAMEGQGVPLFIAVDQEGGRVARLKVPFTLFPGNSAIGRDLDGTARALEFGKTTATEMRLVGFNMDMAPVVDVQVGPVERHLEGRIFSDDPRKVAWLGRCVVRALQENGVMAVAKHFPGLGRATRDPHRELPVIPADMAEMEAFHLLPFRAAVEEGVSALMTSHALYPALDPQYPGTLSPRIVTGLVRERLRFEGLVITDDLEMGAVAGGARVADCALAAFGAGCDILLICKDQGAVREAMGRMEEAILGKEVPEERLHASVQRILRAKERFIGRPTLPSLDDVRRYFSRE